ncbi:RNase H family protein, partial [Escherichia coli]
IFPKMTAAAPIAGAANIFTDGSKTGCGAYMIEHQDPVQFQYQPGSPQIVELKIVIEVFKACSFAFNLISDSAYVVNAVNILGVAGPIKGTSPLCLLFKQLQHLIWQRRACFSV